MQPIQGRQHELPKANVEDSEGDSDLEDKGGLVDLDLMPVEVEVEGLIVEVERPRVASEDADAEEDAHRTGKPHLFMSKSLEVKQESPSMQTLMVAIPTTLSNSRPVVK